MSRHALSTTLAPGDEDLGHDQAAARVLQQFRQIFNAVKTHFQQVEKKVGVGGAQVWALAVMKEAKRDWDILVILPRASSPEIVRYLDEAAGGA